MLLFGVYVALRLIPLNGASYGEAAEYAKNINAYPLSQTNNPPKGNYVDMAGKHLPTLPVYDLSFFENIAELVNEEPQLERDKVMGDPTRTVHSRGWAWGGIVVAVLLFAVFIPLITQVQGTAHASFTHFNPSVKQLGLVLMDPYFASVGVIALLLTAGLIGAVVAASSASDSNET